ncbi:50S ribosomal protein L25 [Patescibacteria group bacterium]|nr:50S ribosomal protein L25 [Patescibacteria group bacterium]
MDKIILEVTEGVYDTAKAARTAGRIPMAYYGKGSENHGFSVNYQDFRRAYEKGGRSTIMYFVNEKKKEFPVLVQDIQYDPVSDHIIHVDVMAVDMKKPITTTVPLVLTGEAPAVRELGGVLVQNKNKVQVECLPNDLIHKIEVDITLLVDFHSSITVGNIQVPDTIKILDAPDINVAIISAPRAVEEEKPVEVEVEETEVEESDEEKKEE